MNSLLRSMLPLYLSFKKCRRPVDPGVVAGYSPKVLNLPWYVAWRKGTGQVRETRVAAGAHVQQKDVIKKEASRLQVFLWLVEYMVSQLLLTQMDWDHWVLIGYCPSNLAHNHRYLQWK